MVHYPLYEERAHHREYLDREREQEKLSETALEPDHAPDERAEPDARRRLGGLEPAHRRQLKSYAGEVPGHQRQRQAAHADGRVMDHDAVAVGTLQHHEVVKVPVQDARRPQLPQLVQFETYWPRCEPELVGHADQVLQADALQRDGEAAAELGNVDRGTIVACDHREAGEAALGGFRLQCKRQPCPPTDLQLVEQTHYCHFPVRVNSGSSTHSYRRRLSSTTSASSSMPACSGTGLP